MATDASNSNTAVSSGVKSENEPASLVNVNETGNSADAQTGNGEDHEQDPDNEGENEEEGGRRTRKRRLGVDPSLIISDGRSKRRRTPSPGPVKKEEESDPKDAERATVLGREIYNMIMESKDAEGDSMAEPFIKLPPKRQFPDYYEFIKNPMSLDTVDAKLTKKEYQTLKEVVTDIGQIFNNAKRYNMKESLLFIYAKKLHKMTRTFYAKTVNPEAEHHESEDEAPPARHTSSGPSAPGGANPDRRVSVNRRDSSAIPEEDEEHDAQGTPNAGRQSMLGVKRGSYMKNGPTVYKLVKPVMKIIKDTKSRDGSGRDVAGIFETLPDRRELPEYYVAIKNPISLAEIDDRMVNRRYETWEEFFADVELMCANAMEYNEDGSEVYQDAVQIKEILDYNRAEIKTRLTLPIHQQRQRLKPVNNTPHRASQPLGTPSTAGGGHIPLPGDRHSASASPHPSPHPHIQAQQGYYGSSMAPSLHPHMPSAPSYPSAPPTLPQSSHVPQQQLAQPPVPQFARPGSSSAVAPSVPRQPSGPPAPSLPHGMVSEEIVASLSRFTEDQRRAWIGSLNPNQIGLYRQYATIVEARRRNAAGQPAPPLADPPSAARTTGTASAVPMHKRAKPGNPGIKLFEIGFKREGRDEWDEEDGEKSVRQHSIRLYNMRGVGTHALLVGQDTRQVDLTVYFADIVLAGLSPSLPSGSESGTGTAGGASLTAPSTPNKVPEVTLRVNGEVSAAAPTIVYDPPARYGPDGVNKEVNGSTGDAHAGVAKGIKWTVQLPSNKSDSVISVTIVRQAQGQPGAGSITEQSHIIVTTIF